MYVSQITHTLLPYPLLLLLSVLLAVLRQFWQLWTRCPTWDLSYRQCIAAFTQRWKITEVSKNKTHVDTEYKKIQKWQQPWFWLPSPRQMRLNCYQSCHELYPDLLFCSVSCRQWQHRGKKNLIACFALSVTGDGSCTDGLFACFALSMIGDGSYIEGLFVCFAVSNTGVSK